VVGAQTYLQRPSQVRVIVNDQDFWLVHLSSPLVRFNVVSC
jgi:hypothetical protein